jgi:hypothetical protein
MNGFSRICEEPHAAPMRPWTFLRLSSQTGRLWPLTKALAASVGKPSNPSRTKEMGKLCPVEQVRVAIAQIVEPCAGWENPEQQWMSQARMDALAKADAIMALPLVKQSDGLAERVKEAEIADRAYARLEGHFRSMAHIARHTLECNADDVRKLEDSAESVARYRKEQRDVHC